MQLETGNNVNNYQLSIRLILREPGGCVGWALIAINALRGSAVRNMVWLIYIVSPTCTLIIFSDRNSVQLSCSGMPQSGFCLDETPRRLELILIVIQRYV